MSSSESSNRSVGFPAARRKRTTSRCSCLATLGSGREQKPLAHKEYKNARSALISLAVRDKAKNQARASQALCLVEPAEYQGGADPGNGRPRLAGTGCPAPHFAREQNRVRDLVGAPEPAERDRRRVVRSGPARRGCAARAGRACQSSPGSPRSRG